MILVPTEFAKSIGTTGIVGLGSEMLREMPKKWPKEGKEVNGLGRAVKGPKRKRG